MCVTKRLPQAAKPFPQMKSFPNVRRILMLLLVATGLSFFLMPNPWCKFIALQTALAIIALWVAFAAFKQSK